MLFRHQNYKTAFNCNIILNFDMGSNIYIRHLQTPIPLCIRNKEIYYILLFSKGH